MCSRLPALDLLLPSSTLGGFDAHDDRSAFSPSGNSPQLSLPADRFAKSRRRMLPGGINLKITVRETNLEHPAGHERPMPDVVDAKTSSLHQPVADSPLVLLEQNAAKLCQRLRADSVKRPDDLGSVVTEEAR